MRLFFALWPDAATRAELAAASRLVGLRDGRAVPAANLHITLHFLGEVAATALPPLCEAGARVAAPTFALDLAVAGWWPRGRVAWLAPAVVPAALLDLVAGVDAAVAACGLAPVAREQAAYQAHVTVARQVRHAPALMRAFSVPWQITDFALISSLTEPAGARYEVLARWLLMAPSGDESGPATVR